MSLSKEKVASLVKYQAQIQEKLAAPIPAKHKANPGTYKQHLLRELEDVTKKIEDAKMEGVAK